MRTPVQQFNRRDASIALALLPFGGLKAHAASYPTQGVKIVVPFAAGGGTDLVARVFARHLSEALGQAVIVDNRPGAGARLGTDYALQAAPDGHTLLMVSSSYATNAALYKTSYDPITGVTPIFIIGDQGLLLAAGPSAPFKTLPELIAYAKANPGKVNYASAGNGSFSHLGGEYFAQEAKIKLTHIPYKGMSPAYNDLAAGIVHMTFGSLFSTIPHVKSGRLRALAVTSPRRSSQLPETPTVGETLRGFEVISWYGLLGPKGIPPAVTARLNAELEKALRLPDVQRATAGEGLESIGGPPSAFASALRRDVEKWKRLVKAAGITGE